MNLLGTPELTANQFRNYLHKVSPTAPVWVIADYWLICSDYGLRPDVAAAQMLLETGNLTSDWATKHYNLCGLGVTGEPGKGLSFPTYMAGVAAHAGHLWAYVGAYANNAEKDAAARKADPRFDFARNRVELNKWQIVALADLSMKWAMVPDYSERVEKIYRAVKSQSA